MIINMTVTLFKAVNVFLWYDLLFYMPVIYQERERIGEIRGRSARKSSGKKKKKPNLFCLTDDGERAINRLHGVCTAHPPHV